MTPIYFSLVVCHNLKKVDNYWHKLHNDLLFITLANLKENKLRCTKYKKNSLLNRLIANRIVVYNKYVYNTIKTS